MLTKEENDILTRVGAGTPMGELFRGYWLPLLLSSDLPERDGKPIRVRLLGERLVAFRDTRGKIGLLSEFCPHRRASLFFGRNEECGLRCVYHGWKFDTDGNCVDLPSEQPDSKFREKVRVVAYPCEERNGIIWTRLGSGEPAGLPDIEWGLVPESQRYISRRILNCNWGQALEGDIDTAHASFLHARLNETDYDRFPRARAMRYMDRDGHPAFDVLDTDYGIMIGARRAAESESYYWRVTQVIFPCFSMPAPYEDLPFRCNVWLPMDDKSTVVWTVDWHPTRDLTPEELNRRNEGTIAHCVEFMPETSEAGGRWRPRVNKSNDYLLDHERQRKDQYSGIREVWAQDMAMSESMGEILDRTREHLGTSDQGIIRWRRRLIAAARAYAASKTREAPGMQPHSQLVRAASFVLPRDASWMPAAEAHSRAGLGVPVHPGSI